VKSEAMIITVGYKRYTINSVSQIKELLIKNKDEITFKYEGFGSYEVKGINKKLLKELKEIL